MITKITLIGSIAIVSLCACGDGIADSNGYGSNGGTSGNYFAVVGYYNNGQKEFKDLGVSKLDECRAKAFREYSAINARNSNRAFDWFCKNTHSGRIDR